MNEATAILLAPEPTVPPPVPLATAFPAVEPLTREMLPPVIVDFVFDVSDRSQCPPEYVAVSTLIALGSLLGSKFVLRPKQNDNWEILPNLWGALIGPPSSMKSPAMKEALKPIVRLEQDLGEIAERERQDQALLSQLEVGAAKKQQKQAEDLYAEGRKEEALAIMKATQPEEVATRQNRLLVNDTSVEKLGELLNENPNGLLLSRDELYGFLARLSREDGQSERAFYLECFDGNGRFTYDRIGRGTIVIEHCVLSLLGGIQPSKIADIIRQAMNGKSDDGLIQRMQLAVWPDKVPKKNGGIRAPITRRKKITSCWLLASTSWKLTVTNPTGCDSRRRPKSSSPNGGVTCKQKLTMTKCTRSYRVISPSIPKP